MSLCPNCGKELPEGVAVCECENQQVAETTINEVPVESPVDETATVSSETPIVTPLESEVPEVDGMLVTSDNNDDDEEYLGATKNCKLINVLSLILFVEGIISLLLINRWMAAILFFVAEIFVLLPNTKVQKLCKAKNSMADKKSQQAKIKETTKRLKSKNINFKFSFIIAIICLVSLIVSFIIPSPLIGGRTKNGNENDITVTDSEEPMTEGKTQAVTETGKDPSTDDSDTSASDGYAVEPIVGGFRYYESVDLFTATPVSTPYPHASYLNFEADGTGNLTVKTNSSNGKALYETTWEFVEIEENMRKYIVYTHTNETLYVYYADDDTCVMFTASAINTYERVKGNAQENVSGITTSSVYDIENTSFDFAYEYDPETKYENTSPQMPYINRLSFYSANGFSAFIKTATSSNPYGLEIIMGKWYYEKTDEGFFYYRIELDEGAVWEVRYSPDQDMCIMVDNNGVMSYFERTAE